MWRALVLVCLVAGARAVPLDSFYCVQGREALIHLFEWKWTDIARECPRLAGWGYCGVQVSPPNEHAVYPSFNYPWWQRYQPVSYKIGSRSGSEAEFIEMVETCNGYGVFIYVDSVINHMTGAGSGIGSDGSAWNGGGSTAQDHGGQDYPGVPYDESHFIPPGPKCEHRCDQENMNINNNKDVCEVRDCRLVSLRTLALNVDYVRAQITTQMNRFIQWGVAGFLIDATKHMWPEHLQAIYGTLNDLNTAWFPSGTKPYIFQEVIDLEEDEPIKASDYTHLGRVTEFHYGLDLSNCVRGYEGRSLSQLFDFAGEDSGYLSSDKALAFIDNHDNQRGHWGDNVLTYHSGKLYKIAVAYMLAWHYGHPRVMSSYAFDPETGTEEGPPSDSNGNTESVVCQSDGGEWVCEHAWPSIHNMVGFHNTAVGEPVQNWWDNGNMAISFSRGNKAFIAINNEGNAETRTWSTGLPAGDYCNVITCDSNRPPCVGEHQRCETYSVDANGNAFFSIPADDDPIVAMHV